METCSGWNWFKKPQIQPPTQGGGVEWIILIGEIAGCFGAIQRSNPVID